MALAAGDDASRGEVCEPRRSSRVNSSSTTVSGDGDTWREKLVVCEASNGKLVIRSYYRNSVGRRNWDEPPSGASRIEAASSRRRQEAEEELKNLKIAMDFVPQQTGNSKKSKPSFSKNKRRFFSSFRNTHTHEDEAASSLGKGARIFSRKTGNGRSTSNSRSIAGSDEEMQRAINLSMVLETGTGSADSVCIAGPSTSYQNAVASKNAWREDQEAVDIAMAISMSEAVNPMNTSNIPCEEEMLQRAIDASRRVTSGVASLPPSYEGDLFGVVKNES